MSVLHGRSLISTPDMVISGEVVVTSQPITLLGFVDPQTGKIVEEEHELYDTSIKDKIFVFPKGIGSTVGPYVLLNLVKKGNAPRAIINRESDQGTVSGCSISKIPLIYDLDQDPIDFLKTGDHIEISINNSHAVLTLKNR